MPTAGQKRKTRGTNTQNNALPPHVVRTTHNSTRYDNYALITPLWIFIWKYILFYFNFLLARLLCFAQEFRLFFFARFFLVFASIVSTFLDRSFAVHCFSIDVSQLVLQHFFVVASQNIATQTARGEQHTLYTNLICISRFAHLFTIFVPMAVINGRLPLSFCWFFAVAYCLLLSLLVFKISLASIFALQTFSSP